MRFKINFLRLLLATFFVLPLLPLQAVTIGVPLVVDFGSQYSVPSTNPFPASQVGTKLTNLIDINNNPTGIDVDVSNLNMDADDLAAWQGGSKDWMLDGLGDDGLFGIANGLTSVVSFTNVPSGQYKVEFISASITGGLVMEVRLNTALTSDNFDDAAVSSAAWEANAANMGRYNWLIWDGVSPNVSNQFNFTMVESGTADSNLVSAIQITAIPEPAHAALIAGLLLLLCHRLTRGLR